ncbi:SDR family NAD(P)-dependent oxidoreductase [Streptomyces brasiliensis]|uniref:SDR family NAD(P)-dependent oxidoreductase n=1 Tax=Streptomyces brasiliensis TaxID=1954 RepID=UPI00166F9830|nr:SDR family NAD(P)-dependent oxidoreductase [Streptomyces brasiliensis]
MRLAQEGAGIIAVDIAAQIVTVPYGMSTPADLAKTVAQVQATGRRGVAGRIDVRDLATLTAEVNRAVNELGRLDVVANAGIAPMGKPARGRAAAAAGRVRHPGQLHGGLRAVARRPER